MSRLPVLLTTGVLAAALGAGALGVASAASPAPTTPAPSSSPAKAGKQAQAKHAANGVLRRVAHGEFVVRQKAGFATIAVQRGEITAVSATSITLASKDGYSHSYIINTATKVRSKGQTVAVGELKTGQRAMVRATKTGATFTATRVACLRDKPAASTAPAPPGSTTG